MPVTCLQQRFTENVLSPSLHIQSFMFHACHPLSKKQCFHRCLWSRSTLQLGGHSAPWPQAFPAWDMLWMGSSSRTQTARLHPLLGPCPWDHPESLKGCRLLRPGYDPQCACRRACVGREKLTPNGAHAQQSLGR